MEFEFRPIKSAFALGIDEFEARLCQCIRQRLLGAVLPRVVSQDQVFPLQGLKLELHVFKEPLQLRELLRRAGPCHLRAVEQLHQPADLLVRLLPCFGLRVELGLDPRQLLRVRRLQRLELLPVRLLCRRELLGAFLALSGQRRFELRLLLLEPLPGIIRAAVETLAVSTLHRGRGRRLAALRVVFCRIVELLKLLCAIAASKQ